MVVEARRMSAEMKQQASSNAMSSSNQQTLQALDAMGYDEAAQHVYGCHYSEWKKAHAKKASDDQMQKYEASKPIHAPHDEALLAIVALIDNSVAKLPTADTVCAKPSLLSNVCCQDVEEVVLPPPTQSTNTTTRTIPPFVVPALPLGGVHFTCAILTISDRAFKNEYDTGDLSGPAVEKSLLSASTGSCTIVDKTIVPDDCKAIQAQLIDYATRGIHLVLTTGGTGFAPRDVTPEATAAILERPLPGLLAFITTECSQTQPLSSLSRGVAGIRGQTWIVNLPGNPIGVREIVPLLLPIVVHGIKDMQHE
jgi:molybdopterin adenylyltransferase